MRGILVEPKQQQAADALVATLPPAFCPLAMAVHILRHCLHWWHRKMSAVWKCVITWQWAAPRPAGTHAVNSALLADSRLFYCLNPVGSVFAALYKARWYSLVMSALAERSRWPWFLFITYSSLFRALKLKLEKKSALWNVLYRDRWTELPTLRQSWGSFRSGSQDTFLAKSQVLAICIGSIKIIDFF